MNHAFKSIRFSLDFNFTSSTMHVNKFTPTVARTSPLAPRLIGNLYPHGKLFPTNIQSKIMLRKIPIVEILKGLLPSPSE